MNLYMSFKAQISNKDKSFFYLVGKIYTDYLSNIGIGRLSLQLSHIHKYICSISFIIHCFEVQIIYIQIKGKLTESRYFGAKDLYCTFSSYRPWCSFWTVFRVFCIIPGIERRFLSWSTWSGPHIHASYSITARAQRNQNLWNPASFSSLATS